ncbi:MAG: hypothetical protein JWQ81_1450 [Amycolatopsis sp.]|uniref:DUF4192 domain-containing protein n=1 Tax=Amycolatopsis sp. TaxID=37632 RepID=UPI002638F2F4|nr:DUF4192 domain-containing protein [Amycolatopsis sp.]MCU1680711.1 hypothetical protein [Amycolatopsis sp.]
MTSSQTAGATGNGGQTRINLRDPGQLLAAIPYVVGFRPADSVLLIGHRPPRGTLIGLVVRGDLPPSDLRAPQAENLVTTLVTSGAMAATIVVVGGGPKQAHEEFVTIVAELLRDVGVPPMHAMWVSEISSGAPWECYFEQDCGGVLPAVDSTVAAATMASKGAVTFDSREAMEKLLEPVGEAALRRRARLLKAAPGPDSSADSVRRHRRVVQQALVKLAASGAHLTDDEVVGLGQALAVTRVRDACLAAAVPPGTGVARQAERLWLTLVRELPAPERAEAAALLGYTAYARGDGAFAGMALANALRADPKHVLAQLLQAALGSGIEPSRLADLGRNEGVESLRFTGDVSPGRSADAA